MAKYKNKSKSKNNTNNNYHDCLKQQQKHKNIKANDKSKEKGKVIQMARHKATQRLGVDVVAIPPSNITLYIDTIR